MNQQDRSFMVTFTMVISVLVLIAIAIFLISKLVSTLTIHYEDDSRRISSIEDRIKPVYRVAVAATSAEATAAPATPAAPAAAAGGGAPASGPVDLAKGKQVYSTVCMACHATGAAGAPKVTDKAAWEPRAAQGVDTLVTHAIKGIRGMPPKGGNPSLSDGDINNAVHYMLSEAGIKVPEPAAESKPAAPAQPAAPAAPAPPAKPAGSIVPANIDLAHGKQLYNTVCTACHSTGAAGAPKITDKAAW
ncbi:MAG TPA: c-type cytochrome, partial [Candidatus Competibacteraceae bacterium]|nr:c-type cytochrome [Candidatus Competibacteraceae bacterium]